MAVLRDYRKVKISHWDCADYQTATLVWLSI